jgi:hypothetical protein
MKRILLLLSSMGILLLWGALVFSADKVVEAEGTSGISRADAIRQTQRDAVEQAVGVFIQWETEVSNFILQKDKI